MPDSSKREQLARMRSRSNPIERRMTKFLREPPSIRTAASVIVTATAVVVVGGGILIRVLDHTEYPNVWVGMWWAIQTVTTVGYGDVTPAKWSGRIVAAFVMLEGIAFIAIITAAVTSTFVVRAEREREAEAGVEEVALEKRMDARFDEMSQRFDQLESILGKAEPQ